jgi:type IV pilus assembly protein PilA
MSDWYYSTDHQQPSGPVDTNHLRTMLATGQLPAATLLWREGLPRWHSAAELADELGPSSPPETSKADLPPAIPASMHTATTAAAPAAGRPPAAVKPRRTGLIIALVAAGLVAASIPILAILAAIAVPAYQSYTQRAKAAATLAALAPLQAQVISFQQANGQCPQQDSPGFKAAGAYADAKAHLTDVTVMTAVNGHCGLAARLDGLYRDADKRQAWLWLEHDPANDQWICRSTLRDAQLPTHCQR